MWTRRRVLQGTAAGLAGSVIGCGGASTEASDGIVVGAFEPVSRLDCTEAALEALMARIERIDPAQAVEGFVDLWKDGVEVEPTLIAAFHLGARGLGADTGSQQHYSLASLAAARLAGQEGETPAVVAAAWAGDHLVRALGDASSPLGALDETRLPSASEAVPSFDAAMEVGDPEAAEAALIAIVRSHGPTATREALWRWAPLRNEPFGHPAIFAAFAVRVLDACGWHGAEPVLRRAAVGLASGARSFLDAGLRPARALAREITAGTRRDDDAIVEVLSLARTAAVGPAIEGVAALLRDGVAPSSIWTGLALAHGEQMLRYRPAMGTAVHGLDSLHALHFAWHDAVGLGAPDALAGLLATIGWTVEFREACIADSTARPEHVLALDIDRIEPEPTASSLPEALDSSLVDPEGSAAILLGWLDEGGTQAELETTIRDLVLRKSQLDAHEYKVPFALLEELHAIEIAWRPRLAMALTAAGPVPTSADWAHLHAVLERL